MWSARREVVYFVAWAGIHQAVFAQRAHSIIDVHAQLTLTSSRVHHFMLRSLFEHAFH